MTLVTGAAVGVMALTGLLHKEQVEEVGPPPVEPSSSVEVVEAPSESVEVVLQPESTSSEEATKLETSDWWHDTPLTSQHDLTYQHANTEYGCVPASVNMITEYWHQQDPTYKTLSAQDLLDANAEQGVFGAGGMSITDIQDELQPLGYQVRDYVDADLETLKEEVAKGPVVALVKLNMTTDGAPHSVVVTGLASDNRVRVNDPWTGKVKTYAWETFSRSWGSDFDDADTYNHLTIIRPS